MNLITRTMLAQGAPERWRAHYHASLDPRQQQITRDLLALPPEERTGDRIDEIIGNTSWTAVMCLACEKQVEEAVQFDDGGYDRPDPIICFPCLKAAAKLKPKP